MAGPERPVCWPTASRLVLLGPVGQHRSKATRRRARAEIAEEIARWRYEQIEPALPAILTRAAKAQIIRRIAARPTEWPSGKAKRIPRATVYRWIKLYGEGGIEALRPRVRKDRGSVRARLPDDVVQKALRLWLNDPGAGLTYMLALLAADPELKLGERGIKLSKSTLQRRLAKHEIYARLARIYKRARHRIRYVAGKPHDIWHVDAKGPVTIRLVSGAELAFHVLTVLDDATRDALAWLVALSPNLCAAVSVFRAAAKRWGLPGLLYADRASIFDSQAFRSGLSDFGSHRVPMTPRNPEANGKIEAYHRSLARWFTKRLPTQKVVDLVHLSQLLDGVMERIYRDHKHRDLGTTPRAALAGRVSERSVSAQRLDDAFRQKCWKKAHPKTGEVDLPGGKYIVPEELRGQKLLFLLDPEKAVDPVLLHPDNDRRISLMRAAVRPEHSTGLDLSQRHGDGPLQTLYDAWRGKVRPNAEPGFGLPELFALLSTAAGRHVPKSDDEAARIHHLWQAIGPLPKNATEKALADIGRELGPDRPLDNYLVALRRRTLPRVEHKTRRTHR